MIELTTIGNFLSVLSSSAAVPGGGTACAMAGALGVALGEMVANLTSGKARHAEHQRRIDGLITLLDGLQDRLVALADADGEAFAPLAQAYGMPKTTAEERARKEQRMEAALQAACEPPLEIMDELICAIDLLEELVHKGSTLALPDVGAGAALCGAALKAASLNVYANAALMKNRSYAAELCGRCDEMRQFGGAKAERIFDEVMARCRQ